MDSWLPTRINNTTSKYYEAIGLLACTYVDIERTMHLIASAVIANDDIYSNKRTMHFVVRLNAVSLYESVKACAKVRYKKHPEIVDSFNHLCDLADSARIARNAYMHSTFGINAEENAPVTFASSPDRLAPSGREFLQT